MINFTNLEKHPNADTLYPQEIDALLAVISYFCEGRYSGDYGSCILDGQKDGGAANCIFRFNFPEGPYRRTFFRTYDRTSDQIAEDSINEMLCWPENPSRYRKSLENIPCPVATGIYRDGEIEVLVLNTTHGRFLFTCHTLAAFSDDDYDALSEALPYIFAEAIANMGKEDTVLQRSNIELIAGLDPSHSGQIVDMITETRDLFYDKNPLPEIAAWRTWHESADQSDELALFFG